MKKNLFGAVSVGLALALAITSFGCESGHDETLADPYSRKVANYSIDTGKKFKDTVYEYTVAPTAYTAFTTSTTNTWTSIAPSTTTNSTDVAVSSVLLKAQSGSVLSTDAVTDSNYSWTKYVNGVNSYNRLKADWNGAATKGTNIGDVVNTASETITLDTSDNSFKWSKKSTKYEVRGLRTLEEKNWGNASGFASRTAYTHFDAALTQTSAYDTLPFYILPAISTYTIGTTSYNYSYTAFAAVNYSNVNTTTYAFTGSLAEGQYPFLNKGRIANINEADGIIDTAILLAKNALDKAKIEDYALVTGDATNRATYVANAEKNVAILQNLKKQTEYFKRGARISILDTETVDEKTTGFLKYYAAAGGTLIDTEDKSATNNKNKAMTAKFTIDGKTYKDATIVLTEIVDYSANENGDKYVFTDDKDYFYKNDVYGKISDYYPTATAVGVANAKAGSTWTKAGRTLTIKDGKLTAPACDIQFTNHSPKNFTGIGSWGRYGYFLSSAYDTFANLYLYNQAWGVNTTTVDTPVSYVYSYVEK